VACFVILVSYCGQIAKCRVLGENFQGLKVRGRRLVNWSSRILEDEYFRRGQQLCISHANARYGALDFENANGNPAGQRNRPAGAGR